jgi:hypothetical protein
MASKQSITVDYIVRGSLDGVTPAPRVVLGSTRIGQDDQIYQVEVENLGLIDPDLGFGGSIGPRCLTQLGVDFGGIIPTGGFLSVLFIAPDRQFPIGTLFTFAGQPSVGTLSPILVPQGSGLILDGVTAGANPILVRVTIEVPDDPCTLGALLASAGDPGPGPAPCCPPSFAPPEIDTGGQSLPAVDIQIGGFARNLQEDFFLTGFLLDAMDPALVSPLAFSEVQVIANYQGLDGVSLLSFRATGTAPNDADTFGYVWITNGCGCSGAPVVFRLEP